MFINAAAIDDTIVWLNQKTRIALNEKGTWFYSKPFDFPQIEAESDASNRPETFSS
jgi:hypothetical protein